MQKRLELVKKLVTQMSYVLFIRLMRFDGLAADSITHETSDFIVAVYEVTYKPIPSMGSPSGDLPPKQKINLTFLSVDFRFWCIFIAIESLILANN